MPMESLLYVAFVLAALTEFAIVLAYADWATRRARADEASQLSHAGHQAPANRDGAPFTHDRAA